MHTPIPWPGQDDRIAAEQRMLDFEAVVAAMIQELGCEAVHLCGEIVEPAAAAQRDSFLPILALEAKLRFYQEFEEDLGILVERSDAALFGLTMVRPPLREQGLWAPVFHLILTQLMIPAPGSEAGKGPERHVLALDNVATAWQAAEKLRRAGLEAAVEPRQAMEREAERVSA